MSTNGFVGLETASATCVWEQTRLPEVLAPRLRDTLAALVVRLKAGVPAAPTATGFERGAALRPQGHRRAFYIRLTPQEGGGYLAVKGTEPLLLDELRLMAATGVPFAWWRGAMVGQTRAGIHSMSAIDVFPITEHKVPMVLTLREALDEAGIADEVFRKYVERYGEAPDLPLPLLVARWPDAVVAAFWEEMRPLLSSFAAEIAERLLAGGAACYVYHYPVAPFPRVAHVADALRDAGPARLARLEAVEAPAAVIARWIRLFTRLLALGYLPAVASQNVTGQAVQAQNVIVGGGFVDLDSLKAIAAFATEREFAESYGITLQTFVHSVASYLFGEVDPGPGTTTPEILCYLHVGELLRRAIAEEVGTYGNAFSPRLRAMPPFAGGAGELARLAEMFQEMPQLQTLIRLLEGAAAASAV